jgi:hypothetical protein
MKKLIATLAVVVVALGAGFASAATKYPTDFTKFKGTPGGPGVKGKIDSSKDKCVKKRKVSVFDKNKNNTKVASGKTNSKGKFEIPLGQIGKVKGPYYAKVKKKDLDGNKVCGGAKSKTIIL